MPSSLLGANTKPPYWDIPPSQAAAQVSLVDQVSYQTVISFRFVSTSQAGNVVSLAAMHAGDSRVTVVFILIFDCFAWKQVFSCLIIVITATWIILNEQNTLWA